MEEFYIQTSEMQEDYISFKSECECKTHDLKITFEKDPLSKEISLYLKDTMHVNEIIVYSYNHKSFFKRLMNRFRVAFNILFKGYFSFDYEFMFKNEKHVEQFMNYMNKVYNKIKQNKFN